MMRRLVYCVSHIINIIFIISDVLIAKEIAECSRKTGGEENKNQ